MSGKRGFLWLVAGLALTLLVGRAMAGLYGDWAFHHALGADALWRERMFLGTAQRLLTFAASLAFVFANLFAVRQSIVALVLPRTLGGLEISEAVPPRRLTQVAFAVSLLLALLFATTDQDWTRLAQALHGVPFGEYEPYLDHDLGAFVHRLPLERWTYELASVVLASTALLVVVAYAITPSIRWDARGLYVSTWVRRHLGILGGLGIALIGWSWRLDRLGLLIDGSGGSGFRFERSPFGLFDHRVLLPYLTVLSFAALPVAVVFAAVVWRGAIRIAFGLLTALVLAGPVARVLLPSVAPAARAGDRAVQARTRPYESTRMLFTRRAFGVDRIASADSVSLPLLDDAAAARGVSSWDPAALARFLERERRGADVAAVSWIAGPMGLEATLLRTAPDGAPPGTRWPADRLRAEAADAAGLPMLSVLPGAAGVAGVLVHPGAPRYALVADTLGRLAAPPFESVAQRVLLSWGQQNPRLLAVEAPRPRPRLMTVRDALERLGTLTPFLAQGETVTPVVRGDSLYWVVELFAVSETYPLSERMLVGGRLVQYAQHAATAVVQAQSGAVTLLPVMHPDPVMRTWMARFPSLFTPRARAPRWMTAGLPPAVDWAMVQGTMLGRTGVQGDTLPVRQLARVDDADADLTTGPPTLFQLDSLGTLGWGVPVANADRLAGLLVARGGSDPVTVLLAPGDERDWTAILEDLQQSADEAGIGRSLRDSRRGRVQTIPTTSGPLFVQAFYEWPPDGPPHLAGVATLRGTDRRVGRTLADALGQSRSTQFAGQSTDALRAQAAHWYDAMAAALRAGDWRAYGEAWAALGRLLGRPAR